jgi:PadR family transcriptional regulator, regulatory protein AphA
MPARHAILALLSQRPLHGYDIDSEFDKGLRPICHINISQIYAYLKSMEEKGWVRSKTVIQKSNPPKKVFHVTDAGRVELDEWLRQPVQAERQIRDELLTKIRFCWDLAPESLPGLIDEQIRIHKERLEELEMAYRETTDPVTSLLLDAGRRHAQADYEWLQSVSEHLREQQGASAQPD